MKTFKYCLVNRPASVGAVPKVLFTLEPRSEAGQPHHELARHGIMVTEKELTEEECKAFELSPCIDTAQQLDWLACRISNTMKKYAGSYVTMAADEPCLFRSIVLQRINTVRPGIYYSVSYPEALLDMVYLMLQDEAKFATF